MYISKNILKRGEGVIIKLYQSAKISKSAKWPPLSTVLNRIAALKNYIVNTNQRIKAPSAGYSFFEISANFSVAQILIFKTFYILMVLLFKLWQIRHFKKLKMQGATFFSQAPLVLLIPVKLNTSPQIFGLYDLISYQTICRSKSVFRIFFSYYHICLYFIFYIKWFE